MALRNITETSNPGVGSLPPASGFNAPTLKTPANTGQANPMQADNALFNAARQTNAEAGEGPPKPAPGEWLIVKNEAGEKVFKWFTAKETRPADAQKAEEFDTGCSPDCATGRQGWIRFNPKGPNPQGKTEAEKRGWQFVNENQVPSRYKSLADPDSTVPPEKVAAAQKIIADNYGLLTGGLDETKLARSLAETAKTDPVLAREVLRQLAAGEAGDFLKAGQTSRVARLMLGNMTNGSLDKLARAKDGEALLIGIQKWIKTNPTGFSLNLNSIFAPQVDDAATQKRLSQIFAGAKERPAKYSDDDIIRLFGNNSYNDADYWINSLARGEGGFNDAVVLRDGAGLSVGIKQWTRNSGRLGTLLQGYKDAAEKAGRLDEFYKDFGGKENAEALLKNLKSNPSAVSDAAIKPLFQAAGAKDVYQRAQVELARREIGRELQPIQQNHPYASDKGITKQSVATSLIAYNIGPNLLPKVYQKTVDSLYADLVKANPQLAPQGGAPSDEFKRQLVVKNVSEADFNTRLATVAPTALYSGANYKAHAQGLTNRINEAIRLYPADEKTVTGK